MNRLLLAALLMGLAAGAAPAQNRAPVRSTQRPVGTRVSPLPGVTLPTGASQRNAEPLAVPVRPNGMLPLPAIPRGDVTAGPVDSGQVQPATRRPTTPARSPRRRP